MTAIEFTVLLATFLISLSIVWSSLRTGITPVPSNRKARQAILTASEHAPEGIIVELGSGWGTLALALAKKYPLQQVIGYELSLAPWLVSLCRQKLHRLHNLSLRRKNFLTCNLADAKLLVCYLYPGGMTKLHHKLQVEKPEVDILISNTFALPNTEPEQVIRLNDLYRSPIYVYRFAKEEKSDIEK